MSVTKLTWKGTNFLLDEKPFQFLSGEMHYQRIPHELWRHRLQMAKAMGLNSVAIYMFWNFHELEPGKFNFEKRNNVAKFVKIAQEEGLWVIIRPGPYCCAEWDFGGLPPWLLAKENIRVRCMNPDYIEAVDRYVRRWSEELVPLQSTKGGPILTVQVENEYGSYGSDKEYLRYIKNLLEEVGFEVPLFTCDGGSKYYLEGGSIPELLCMANFGSNPESNFKNLAKFRPDIPQMCCEYYPGWFTHWGNRNLVKTTSLRIKEISNDLKWMTENNKSWNLYMFHGGTNWGFSAGANFSGRYSPDITSYDYSAPLNEAGHPTEQFHAYRKILSNFQPEGESLPDIPECSQFIDIPPIQFTESSNLIENLEKDGTQKIKSPQIKSMECYGQSYGMIVYRTTLSSTNIGHKMIIKELRDYGHVFLNGKKIATLNRLKKESAEFKIKIPKFDGDSAVLEILVESMGRINYGSLILDRKGITELVGINYQKVLMNWEVFLIPMDENYIEKIPFTPILSNEIKSPAFYRGYFDLKKVGDTYLDCRSWQKGMVWINGHNLGRFWDVGPIYSLYVPTPWLKEGKNEIIVFNMEDPTAVKKLKKLYKKLWKSHSIDEIVRDIPPLWGLTHP
jgi:beta-galactosidase